MVAKGIFTPLDSLYIKELSNYVEKWSNFNFTWVRTLEMNPGKLIIMDFSLSNLKQLTARLSLPSYIGYLSRPH